MHNTISKQDFCPIAEVLLSWSFYQEKALSFSRCPQCDFLKSQIASFNAVTHITGTWAYITQLWSWQNTFLYRGEKTPLPSSKSNKVSKKWWGEKGEGNLQLENFPSEAAFSSNLYHLTSTRDQSQLLKDVFELHSAGAFRLSCWPWDVDFHWKVNWQIAANSNSALSSGSPL